METRAARTVEADVLALTGDTRTRRYDAVVGEEPLELRLQRRDGAQTLAVTMRTPGNDFELAAGFLYGEGVVTQVSEIAELRYCLDSALDAEQRYNIVTIELRAALDGSRLARFERHFSGPGSDLIPRPAEPHPGRGP